MAKPILYVIETSPAVRAVLLIARAINLDLEIMSGYVIAASIAKQSIEYGHIVCAIMMI